LKGEVFGMEVKTGIVKETNGVPSLSISDDFLATELGWQFGSLVRIAAEGNKLILQKIDASDIDYKDEFIRLVRKVAWCVDEL
jgi:hypothetical protein